MSYVINQKIRINNKRKTACEIGKMFPLTLFFKGTFKNGLILAFYTENPCGTCYDRDTGWVVIDLKQKLIKEETSTKKSGINFGEAREALKDWKERFGKVKIFKDNFGGDLWKMNN